MARGYQRRHAEQWRRTRWLGTILLNAHRGAGDAPLAPEDVMHLYGDPPPAPPMDEETFEATMARLAEFDNLQNAA